MSLYPLPEGDSPVVESDGKLHILDFLVVDDIKNYLNWERIYQLVVEFNLKED